jgi:hypothetical protein
MKRLFLLVMAAAFSLTSFGSLAQSTDAPVDHQKAAKDKKKKDYAQKQKAMEDASKSSASGGVAGASTDKSMPKNRPGGANAMEAQMDLQENKPSKPVDKNAQGAPRPNASKMTQAERDAYRKDVVKEAKP